MSVELVPDLEQTIADLEKAIQRALEGAERNDKPFAETEVQRLARLDKKTRKLRLDNTSLLRQKLVQAACAYARNILRADRLPLPVHLDGLIDTMVSLNHGDGYMIVDKVRLGAYLALLAQLAKKFTAASEAAYTAVHASKCLDDLTQGTLLLVYGEVGQAFGQDIHLRMALECFKRVSNSNSALLMEYRTRERLISHYSYYSKPLRRWWHEWRNRGIKTRLVNDMHCQSHELDNARLLRIPPTLH